MIIESYTKKLNKTLHLKVPFFRVPLSILITELNEMITDSFNRHPIVSFILSPSHCKEPLQASIEKMLTKYSTQLILFINLACNFRHGRQKGAIMNVRYMRSHQQYCDNNTENIPDSRPP